jgi:hypothetical protein
MFGLVISVIAHNACNVSLLFSGCFLKSDIIEIIADDGNPVESSSSIALSLHHLRCSSLVIIVFLYRVIFRLDAALR